MSLGFWSWRTEPKECFLGKISMNIALSYLLVSAATIAIDFVWLGFIANKIILNYIRPYVQFDAAGGLVVREHYAILCWLLIVFGVYHFVVRPGFDGLGTQQLMGQGMIFGLVTYGVYDLTTAAIQTLWPIQMIFLDVAWGGVLCAVCAALWRIALLY